ncbi:MAG: hypothetical protein SFU56_22065 [Capsulimonadales bacterium]|nr:hypothetical protein [Capsulimonadales bacterium]
MHTIPVLLRFASLASLFLIATVAFGQDRPARSERTLKLRDAVRVLESRFGVPILAETSVAGIPVRLPGERAEDGQPLALENTLAEMVRRLPPGTRHLTLVLPPPPGKSRFRADDLADLVLAHEKMFGRRGDSLSVAIRPVPAGPPTEKEVTVHLIFNPHGHASLAFRGGEFDTLSPEGKKEWIRRAGEALLRMDAETRAHTLKGLLYLPSRLMETVMTGLSEADMAEFVTAMGGEVRREPNKVEIAFPQKDD